MANLGRPLQGTSSSLLPSSTTEPYTFLESGVYGSLKAALVPQIQKWNPGLAPPFQLAGDKLCYVGTELNWVPRIAILFANNVAMELGVANIWYRDGPSVCLAILPTRFPGEASVLGSLLQRGRPMTIQLAAGGLVGTLTF